MTRPLHSITPPPTRKSVVMPLRKVIVLLSSEKIVVDLEPFMDWVIHGDPWIPADLGRFVLKKSGKCGFVWGAG